MRSKWRRLRRRHNVPMDITAFMNLMVVLVPFLLITAVFSRMAILELNLPGPGEEQPLAAAGLQLEVTVRPAVIQVGDRDSGLFTELPATAAGHDFAALTEYLKKVKGRFPDKTDVTLLLEPDIPYDVLVQVMDAVRVFPVADQGRMMQAELFPDIAIGDAPRRAQEG
jgi:biopolymer transport protein ExbD